MRISFDFDGTLDDEFGGYPINKQKKEIQDLAKKYIIEGHEVIIITKRFSPDNSDLGIKNEHVRVQNLANEIGIKDIYFTNRVMKYGFLNKLGVDRHFENDDYEVSLIKENCNCEVVPVEDPYWRDLVY